MEQEKKIKLLVYATEDERARIKMPRPSCT